MRKSLTAPADTPVTPFRLTVSAADPFDGIAKVCCEVEISAPSMKVLVMEEEPSCVSARWCQVESQTD